MTLQFPATPSINQRIEASNGIIYRYDGEKWITEGSYEANNPGGGGDGASVSVGGTPPPDPEQGDLWFEDNETLRLYVYYNDGSSSQWVDASPDTDPESKMWTRNGTTLEPQNSGDEVVVNQYPTGQGVLVGGNSVEIRRDSSGRALAIYNSGSTDSDITASISEDGSITADGDIQSGGTPENADGVQLRAIGLVKAARASGNDVWAGYTTGSGTATSSITSDGDIAAGANPSVSGNGATGVRLLSNGCAVSYKPDQTPPSGLSSAAHHLLCYSAPSSGASKQVVARIGNDGTISGKNVTFNLEPDNPANYVTTTNAEGETESVYNGPKIDVKALLLEFQTKIQTLETAKTALETRLAAVEADHANMNMNNGGGSY